ncbi:unnamed protein product [Cyclocybe aegerita]|uniref:methionyl-tRNA formyltransferase n=1 Tax=Cyclocybe aegerita TaxID=1973307 RepID=A0A8S0WW60_CYCAE|nr:unnamed protein product [Cyclocybe aegerita]
MGRDEFSCLVLEELYKANDVWKQLVIATTPDKRIGRRGSVLSISPLKQLGEKFELPVYTIPQVKKEFRSWALPPPFELNPAARNDPPQDHLLITASFGRILSERMLSLFQYGRRLNVHPSLLPAYRGPAPIQHSILDDEKETGVCVIEMLKKKEGIDAGSLWGCAKMDMPLNPTFPTLRDMLATEGGKLLVSVLRDMINGKAVAQSQSPAENAPKASFILPADAIVNFHTMTADEIYRRWRAISHQTPLVLPLADGKPLHLLSVDLAETWVRSDYAIATAHLPVGTGTAIFVKKQNALLVRCAKWTILSITAVKPENKPARTAAQFWNGLPEVKAGEKDVVLGELTGQVELDPRPILKHLFV